MKISEPLLVGGLSQARDRICFEPWVWRTRHDQQGLWREAGNRRLLALERLEDRCRRCRARRSRTRSWSIGGLLSFQGRKLGFEIQDALLAGRIGSSRSRKPRLHELGKLFGHVLCRLLLLEMNALLSGSKSGQTVQVQVSGLKLLHQLCDENSRPDVSSRGRTETSRPWAMRRSQVLFKP